MSAGRVLAATARLLEHRPFGDVPMQDLAAEADVSIGGRCVVTLHYPRRTTRLAAGTCPRGRLVLLAPAGHPPPGMLVSGYNRLSSELDDIHAMAGEVDQPI